MRTTRRELVDAFSHDGDWTVTADDHRLTFVRADPCQVIVWTVSDGELALLRHGARGAGKRAGAGGSGGLGLLVVWVLETIETFHGERGTMQGTDIAIVGQGDADPSTSQRHEGALDELDGDSSSGEWSERCQD